MKLARNVVITTLLSLGVLATEGACAAEPASVHSLDGNADLCFSEAEKAARGIDGEQLSTMPCRRALRHDPISRADRSAMLHNRGLIEQAQGDLEAAKRSFARAVRLSTTVDKRNLALAQAAHRLGELELAIRQYDLVIDQGVGTEQGDALERIQANRRSAARQLGITELARR